MLVYFTLFYTINKLFIVLQKSWCFFSGEQAKCPHILVSLFCLPSCVFKLLQDKSPFFQTKLIKLGTISDLELLDVVVVTGDVYINSSKKTIKENLHVNH